MLNKFICALTFALYIQLNLFAQTTICLSVESESEENLNNGDINLISTDVELGIEGNRPQAVGIRFTGVNIPNTAVISSATLQFKADETSSGTCNLTIKGEFDSNPSSFSAAQLDVSNRQTTNSFVNWQPAPWVAGNSGSNQTTPDLSIVLNEVIQSSGFASGNSLALIITGSGTRTAENAPIDLCITYTVCGNPNTACDDLNSCTLNDSWDNNCNCVGIPDVDTDNDGICDALDPFPNVANAQILINEVQSSNLNSLADNFGEYDDWIELYNNSNIAIDLAGYFLTDDINNPAQHMISLGNPAQTTISANGFLFFWADRNTTQGFDHVDFKISSGGETIYLFAPDQVTLVDSLLVPALNADESYIRKSDGSANVFKTEDITPGYSNNNSMAYLPVPDISLASGKYTNSQTVALSSVANATVYYTTDGSEPSTNSTIYSGSFNINSSQTIKAMAVKTGFVGSEVISETYIFNSTTTLPILNISIDPDLLWDDQVGMYVKGTNGVNGPCKRNDTFNYFQDWEYKATATLFEKDCTVAFNEGCGLSVSGGCSRHKGKKSLNVSFKSEYGNSKLNYKLFEDNEATVFDGFKVRSGGNAATNARITDPVVQKLIQDELDIDLQHSRPVALYLNGEYWGLYHIRDRMFAGYINTYHSKIDEDNIDLIKHPNTNGEVSFWIVEEVKEGSNVDYVWLHNFIENNDLSIQSNYEIVKPHVDINSCIDYLLTFVYYSKEDWPHNNLKVWQPKTPEGKWRYLMYDMENIGDNGASDISFLDDLLNSSDPNERFNPNSCNPFRQLLQNDEFRNELIQRTNTYINTVWETNRVNTIYNSYKTEVASEIQADYDKWGDWDYDTWVSNNDIPSFFEDRPNYWQTMIDQNFNTSGRVDLTFNFDANTKGTVRLHSNLYDIPYDFSNEYHKNVDIYMHAVPKPGYRFVEWQELTNSSEKYNPHLYKSFSSNQTLTPVFEPALELVINEIHYNPLSINADEEFIELYNPDSENKPLFGYQFNDGVQFTFPENAMINAGEYIVIAKDASVYAGNGYQVFQWECGSLNNDGENIYFSNANEAVIDSVEYNDNVNWDQNADGLGYSLALIDETLDNYQASAWRSQAVDIITPGEKNSFCASINNNPTVVNASCNQANDGFIVNAISGGTPPYSYSWSTGATSNVANSLSPGSYTLTVTDYFGCPYTDSFTITQPSALSTSTTSTNQTYYMANNGTATIAVNGGSPPYTYSWSNGANTSTINNLSPGNYIVQVSDVNGCSISEMVTINAITCAALNVDVDAYEESCYAEGDGSLQITNIQNGIAPYSIFWSNGYTSSLVNNLAAGNYQLTITDVVGCTFTDNYSILAANQFSANTVTTAASSNTAADGTIDLTVSGGTPPYSYYWSTTKTTEDINGLVAASYWVSITDANSCNLNLNNIEVGNGCLPSIVQINYPNLPTQVYQVANFIQSNGMVDVNKQVNFNAGNYIELTNDFEVKQGAEFEAKIEGCN